MYLMQCSLLMFLLFECYSAEFEPLLDYGSICSTNEDCRSGHCVQGCASGESFCIEPRRFYTRFGAPYPSCVDPNQVRVYKKLYNPNVRQIGQTCVVPSNCITQHCVRECDSSEFLCIEPPSFFEVNNIQTPSCVKSYVNLPTNTGPWNIGQPCGTNMHCSSANCIPLCENSSKSRCIEPISSFEKYNISIPDCIATHLAVQNVKLLLDGKRTRVNAKSLFFNHFILNDEFFSSEKQSNNFQYPPFTEDRSFIDDNSHNKPVVTKEKSPDKKTPNKNDVNIANQNTEDISSVDDEFDSKDAEQALEVVRNYFLDLHLTSIYD